jgi:hypothetical protein
MNKTVDNSHTHTHTHTHVRISIGDVQVTSSHNYMIRDMKEGKKTSLQWKYNHIGFFNPFFKSNSSKLTVMLLTTFPLSLYHKGYLSYCAVGFFYVFFVAVSQRSVLSAAVWLLFHTAIIAQLVAVSRSPQCSVRCNAIQLLDYDTVTSNWQWWNIDIISVTRRSHWLGWSLMCSQEPANVRLLIYGCMSHSFMVHFNIILPPIHARIFQSLFPSRCPTKVPNARPFHCRIKYTIRTHK